ncbi:hypothetical protein QE152_g9585 [Popillia japonica]|uniref:Uncharacterized protein n=1 Tax=Popillia japonica TaxID=7064 RepID=A0AAW1LXD6_POPJA
MNSRGAKILALLDKDEVQQIKTPETINSPALYQTAHDEEGSDLSDCDESLIDKNYEPNISDFSDSLSSSLEIEVQNTEQEEPSAEQAKPTKKNRWRKASLEIEVQNTEQEEPSAEQAKPTKKNRWRKAKPETWKKHKNRKLRDECLPYKN